MLKEGPFKKKKMLKEGKVVVKILAEETLSCNLEQT